MILSIVVKANAKREQVEQIADGSYRVSVNAPPLEGKANDAVIQVLADHFSIPKSTIQIIRGKKGKKKLVELSQYRHS